MSSVVNECVDLFIDAAAESQVERGGRWM